MSVAGAAVIPWSVSGQLLVSDWLMAVSRVRLADSQTVSTRAVVSETITASLAAGETHKISSQQRSVHY